MRFRAIYVSCFIYPFQSADALLFVELRTLRQICDTVEIFHFEEIGASLGARRNQLRGEDLGESAPIQEFPEAGQQGRLDAKDIPHRRIAQGSGRYSISVSIPTSSSEEDAVNGRCCAAGLRS